jgi:hypothetical protein
MVAHDNCNEIGLFSHGGEDRGALTDGDTRIWSDLLSLSPRLFVIEKLSHMLSELLYRFLECQATLEDSRLTCFSCSFAVAPCSFFSFSHGLSATANKRNITAIVLFI